MKIIGAGFARTGTLSTRAALQTLGYPCYHMAEVILNFDHLRTWHDFVVGGERMDWQQLFREREATVDFPAAWFYRELMQAFPDAKVLLNVRDPQRWYDSYMTLTSVHEEFFPHRASSPELDMLVRFLDALNQRIFGASFDRQSLDKERCTHAFEAHIERVKAEVPADRLLVFSVKEGWEPLCRFLGHDVPADEPFPHLNEGGDAIRAAFRHIFLPEHETL